jgi:hypothetical protein
VLYLLFGLVPVILAHAAYNLSLLSLPLWAVAAPGIWVDRALVVVLGLVPLWIVLYHVVRRGLLRDLPDELRNQGWTPPREGVDAGDGTGEARESGWADEGSPPLAGRDPQGSPIGPLPLAGAAAVGILLLATGGIRLEPELPSLQVDRTRALELAGIAVEGRGISVEEGWTVLSTVRSGREPAHRFVWEEGGAEAHRTLLGTYLAEPGWAVRFARFTGPVDERAEELRVELGPDGSLRRIQLRLPEARGGASLPEEEAREAAERFLLQALTPGAWTGGLPQGLVEISAEATERPNRRDWSFTWSDRREYPLDRGDARIRVSLVGDEPSDLVRFVHTPEEWDRQERARSSGRALRGSVSGGLLLLLLGGGALAGGIRWARGRFHRPWALRTGGVVLLFFTISALNGLPSTRFGFLTTLGLTEQTVIHLAGVLLAGIVLGAALALNAGWIHGSTGGAGPARDAEPASGPEAGSRLPGAPAGAALGLLVAGTLLWMDRIGSPGGPTWPSSAAAGNHLPLLTPALGAPVPFLTYGLFLLLAVAITNLPRATGIRGTAWKGAALVGAGLAAPGPRPGDGTAGWLLSGLVLAAGLLLLARMVRTLGWSFVPWMLATVLSLEALRQGILGGYPGAAVAHFLAVGVLAALAHAWTRLPARA